MSPKRSTPFFRYVYIIEGDGAVARRNGKTRYGSLNVEGFYFGFWSSKSEREILKKAVQTWYKVLAPSWWDVARASEEETSVFSHEAKGLGFYNGAILITIYVDERPIVVEHLAEKIHLRHRLAGRSFFERTLRVFTEFRRGRWRW